MRFSTFIKPPILVSLLITVGLSMAQETASDVTIDGLHLSEDSRLARVYMEPGIDMSRYQRVYLDDAYVAFKRNWQREKDKSPTQRVSSAEMALMKIDLSSLFREIFSLKLEEGGYELVTERGEDVLRIKPAIINLDVSRPRGSSDETAQSFTESAGEMTLYLELYDSLTDDLIAKAYDRQIDRQTGYIQWQNRINNRAAARRILSEWADVLREGLDDARGIENLTGQDTEGTSPRTDSVERSRMPEPRATQEQLPRSGVQHLNYAQQ